MGNQISSCPFSGYLYWVTGNNTTGRPQNNYSLRRPDSHEVPIQSPIPIDEHENAIVNDGILEIADGGILEIADGSILEITDSGEKSNNCESMKFIENDPIRKITRHEQIDDVLTIDNQFIKVINQISLNKFRVTTSDGIQYQNIRAIIPLLGNRIDSVKKIEKIEKIEKKSECVSCLINPCEVVIVDCGHVCLCIECLWQIVIENSGSCPICRKKIKRAINGYF
jgi:hypothetical protein